MERIVFSILPSRILPEPDVAKHVNKANSVVNFKVMSFVPQNKWIDMHFASKD